MRPRRSGAAYTLAPRAEPRTHAEQQQQGALHHEDRLLDQQVQAAAAAVADRRERRAALHQHLRGALLRPPERRGQAVAANAFVGSDVGGKCERRRVIAREWMVGAARAAVRLRSAAHWVRWGAPLPVGRPGAVQLLQLGGRRAAAVAAAAAAATAAGACAVAVGRRGRRRRRWQARRLALGPAAAED